MTLRWLAPKLPREEIEVTLRQRGIPVSPEDLEALEDVVEVIRDQVRAVMSVLSTPGVGEST